MQKITVVAVCALLSFNIMADVPNSQRREVAHLLQFVQSSQCVIERNGDEHNGRSAAKHMTKKYRHFRDDIENTEDFIRLSATKSTMSGKYYQVKCPGEPTIRAQDWLLEELRAFRRKT